MSHIILVAETGADIPQELAREYGIYIVPMHVSFGDTTRDDGTFPADEVCEYYERTKQLPKTSGSTPGDFEAAFDAIHAQWPQAQILHLAYSACTTCSYESARMASVNRDYVTSLDTKMVAMGQGAVVLRMAKLLRDHPEWGMAEAVSAAEKVFRQARMCFIPDNLEYLRAGGRVSNVAALCGSLLHIHPLIEILDGHLIATRKLRGKMDKLMPQMVAEYAEKNRLEREELWLIWTPGLSKERMDAAEKAAYGCGFARVNWAKTGGVITAHGGKGAFGIVGFAEE